MKTSEIVAGLRQQKDVKTQIPPWAFAGLPIPFVKDSTKCLGFVFCPLIKSEKGRKLARPVAWCTVSCSTGNVLSIRVADSLQPIVDQTTGYYPNEDLRHMTVAEGNRLYSDYYAACDEFLETGDSRKVQTLYFRLKEDGIERYHIEYANWASDVQSHSPSSLGDLQLRLEALFRNPIFAEERVKLENVLKRSARMNYNVVVVGEFNRGKSTFLNALIGRELLPSGDLATTALPTKIVNASQLRLRHVVDGVAHDVVDLKVLKADRYGNDPKGSLLVECPMKWAGDANIALYDTPGVGDTVSVRADIARDAILFADCTVFVMAADMACSLTEISFLKENIILKKIPNVIVLLTKFDHLDRDESDQALSYVEQKVHAVMPSAKICLYRGYCGSHPEILWATEISKIRDGLVGMATSQSVESDRRVRLINEMLLLLASAKERLSVLSQAEQMSLKKREEAALQLRQKRSSLNLGIERIALEIESRKMGARRTVEENFRAFESELKDDLAMSLRRTMNPKEWLEAEFPMFVKKAFKAFSVREHSRLRSLLVRDKDVVLSFVKREFSTSDFEFPAELMDVQIEVANSGSRNLAGGVLVTNTERMRIVSRCAAIAAVPLALILTGGIAGITMVASGGVGLGAELFTRKKIKEQKETLLPELSDRIRIALEGMEEKSLSAIDASYDRLSDCLTKKAKEVVDGMLEALTTSNTSMHSEPAQSDTIGREIDLLKTEFENL